MIALPYLTELPGAYAGVGSRETPRIRVDPDGRSGPDDVLFLMERIARKLCRAGWTLRSGAAPGADTAFASGSWYLDGDPPQIVGKREIFLPWPEFEKRKGKSVRLDAPTPEAFKLAARFHPNWGACSTAARSLLARNAHQVLGADLRSPSRFVVCWTPDGATSVTTSRTGGTGQAIRIAAAYNVPVWNLQRADHRAAWERLTS